MPQTSNWRVCGSENPGMWEQLTALSKKTHERSHVFRIERFFMLCYLSLKNDKWIRELINVNKIYATLTHVNTSKKLSSEINMRLNNWWQ